MKYTVHLVQRGISSPTHPVSGKSGKLYGHALASPQDGGVMFTMSLQQYQEAAHDLIGNTAAAQQWVPEIVQEAGGEAVVRERCGIPGGCRNLATHEWERFLFCKEHAPNNAVPIGEPPLPKPAPVKLPEARPVLKEARQEEAKKEVLPPPAVADSNVSSETSRSYPRINVPRPRPPSDQLKPFVAAGEPAKASPDASPITEAALPIGEEVKVWASLAEMSYADLRDKASELGIHPVGKSAANLRELIAAKTEPQPVS